MNRNPDRTAEIFGAALLGLVLAVAVSFLAICAVMAVRGLT